MTETIEQRFECKQDITTLILGIVFDGLKYKTLRLQSSEYIISILLTFLENCTFTVKIQPSLSTTRTIPTGGPQGSILGPILFNIYIYDFPVPYANLAMFPDDTGVLTRDQNLEHKIAVTNILIS